MFPCWNLWKEEVGVLARPVGRGDDLPRYEESVDEEREVERIRLGVEVVLSDAHCESVRSALRDVETPRERARALGCVCDAFSIRAPRSRRGGERRTRNRRPGGNRRPVDVRDERIAARVAQLGIVRRPVAIRIGDDRICPSAEFLDVDESVAVRIFEAVGKERNRAVCSFPRVGHAVAICVGGMRIRPGAEFGKIGKSVAVGIERRVGSVCGIESVPLLPPVGHAVAILIDDADDMEKISPWHIFLLATRLRPKELKSSLARILEVFYL